RRPLISVHLRDIEHRECPGEHAPLTVIVAVVVIGLPGGRNLPPQHDRGGAFPLADLRAGLLPLFVGSPEAVAIFSGEASRPKGQRVDASIAFAGCDIGRAGDTRAVVEPWRTPFACASFNRRDDLGSDARIDVGAVRRGGSVGHEGISAADGASLSHRLNRPTHSGLPLPLPSRRAASVWSFLSRHEVCSCSARVHPRRRSSHLRRPKARPRTRRAKAKRRTAMSRCADEPGVARSDAAGVDARLNPQPLLPRLASVAVIYFVEDGLDPLEVLLQSGALQRGQTLLLEEALHSFTARAHAGRCLTVMQAFGQRIGWQSAGSGVLLSTSDICFRHIAAPGSKKQSASTPTCNVRARLASIVRSRARSANIAGSGPSSVAATSSVFDMRGAAGPESLVPAWRSSK